MKYLHLVQLITPLKDIIDYIPSRKITAIDLTL